MESSIAYLQVVELNNQGVNCLQVGGGDLYSSALCFRSALQLTQSILKSTSLSSPTAATSQQQQEPQHNSSSSRLLDIVSAPAAFTLCERTASSISTTETIKEQILAAQRETPLGPFLFHDAFVGAITLCPSLRDYSEDDDTSLSIVVCSILFNLAVVYYLNAFSLQESGIVQELSQARSIFLKVQDICRTIRSSSNRAAAGLLQNKLELHGSAIVDLLSMAVPNNVAILSFSMLNYDDFAKCILLLQYNATLVLPERYHGSSEIAALLHQCKTVFISNSFLIQPPGVAAAA